MGIPEVKFDLKLTEEDHEYIKQQLEQVKVFRRKIRNEEEEKPKVKTSKMILSNFRTISYVTFRVSFALFYRFRYTTVGVLWFFFH